MKLIAFVLLVTTAACSAHSLSSSGRQVQIAPSQPEKECQYVGEVVGNQGNFLSGQWTSNSNLEQGAINTMKNKAAEMGANRVVLLTNRAGVTGTRGDQSQTNVTMSGLAYRCP